MRAADRCWCDFSSNFFEPFNVTRWEETSVQKLKEELERQQRIEDAKEREQGLKGKATAGGSEMPRTIAPAPTSRSKSRYSGSQIIWSLFNPLRSSLRSGEPDSGATELQNGTVPLPKRQFLRKEYDLRPYGLDLVVDFGWTRE